MKRRAFLQSLAALWVAPAAIRRVSELKPCPTCGVLDHEVWMGFVECFDCHANRKPPADSVWAHYRGDEFIGFANVQPGIVFTYDPWREAPKFELMP